MSLTVSCAVCIVVGCQPLGLSVVLCAVLASAVAEELGGQRGGGGSLVSNVPFLSVLRLCLWRPAFSP